MAKMNYRGGSKAGSTTPHATHMPSGPGSTGMTTPTAMGPGGPGMGKPGLNMGPQMHHHHTGQQDGGAQGGDEVGMFHQMA
jgi:hypothetical protein